MYQIIDVALHLIPVQTRMPLKFGSQVLTRVVCARCAVTVQDAKGRRETGWGETPLSVAWVWPDAVLSWDERETALIECTRRAGLSLQGARFDHPLRFLIDQVELLTSETQGGVPHLAQLVAFSPLDIAVWDAVGRLRDASPFDLLGAEFGEATDLGTYFEGGLRGHHVAEFLQPRAMTLPVWHLVGGLDPLEPSDLTGSEPEDGYPVLLRDWIRRDGLQCLKIKLRGNDAAWDYERITRIGQIAVEEGVDWLTADFNCTVLDPAYVNEILDRLRLEFPRLYGMTLYVEQPFPYDLTAHPIDVHSVSSRKPLFLDESAHDWRYVRDGFHLGWNGVALKTCKTFSGALLSLCWARAHGMSLMVQDLTNPMLAQIPHVLLAAYAGTLCGVESNGMQFYPEASAPEEVVHPGLYRRRHGRLDLSTLGSRGFGYREDEIRRDLPPRVI